MTIDQDRSADGLGRLAELASDLTRSTLDVTERALTQFVRHGEVAADHAERVVDDVLARAVDGSGALAELVRSEVELAIGRAGFVRSDELEALRDEIRTLRTELAARDNGRGPA